MSDKVSDDTLRGYQEYREFVANGGLERMTVEQRRHFVLQILDGTIDALNTVNRLYDKAEAADANAREAERRTNSGLASAHLRTLQTERTVQRVADKVGRNDACRCGSGKKAKYCCGAD